jgi:serine/threonine-protein kinase RsbW
MSFTITIPGKAEALADIIQWIEKVSEELTFPREATYAVKLCSEETFMNILMHAYSQENIQLKEEEKVVTLTLDRHSKDIDLIIDDNGPTFDPLASKERSQPQSLEYAPIGGLGITLMKKFSKNIRYEPKPSGNRLLFQFQGTV